MKINKIIVALMALLCLPVCAMAEFECPFTVWDINGNEVEPVEDGDVSWNDDILNIRISGLTVTGGAPGAAIAMWSDGDLTLENVTITEPNCTSVAVAAQTYGEAGPLTLIFKGTNSLTAEQYGIAYTNDITNIKIQMVEDSRLTINASSPIVDATDLDNWVPVSAADIASGSGVIMINGEMVYQYPKPVVELPKTGDEFNMVLWSALAFISMLGMMTLVHKRKEA